MLFRGVGGLEASKRDGFVNSINSLDLELLEVLLLFISSVVPSVVVTVAPR